MKVYIGIFINQQTTMYMQRYFKKTLLIISMIVSYVSNAQSISGNIAAFDSDAALSYSNVDIYKGDDLVASVLADKEGNFTVKLDAGTYRAEINYAGYKTIAQTIHVKDDETIDFGLKEDPESEYVIEEAEEDYLRDVRAGDLESIPSRELHSVAAVSSRGRMIGKKKTYAEGSSDGIAYKTFDRGEPSPVVQGEAGKLTAGEINDFSKWTLWTDLQNDDLNKHAQAWGYQVGDRFTVQVTDPSGLPIANVLAQLLTKDDEVVYTARTDNTGKAELWGTLTNIPFAAKKMNIRLQLADRVEWIVKATPFEKGINSATIDVSCNQSQKVDIAFVVDATGSMSDELIYLTAELNDVIFKSKEISSTLNFSFANVFYRDHGDAYVTKKQNFTRVLSESVAFISQQQAGGGGDFPEAVDVALDTAINGLAWREDARARIVFLILDAPPHNNPEIQQKLVKLSAQAAAKGIRIVPLVASGIDKSTEYLMRSIALATNGTYAFLTDDSGIGGTHLKPSTNSYKVEILNDLLVRIIKSYTYMPDCSQALPELNLPYPSDSVQVASTDSANTDSATVTEPNPLLDLEWYYYPNPTRGIVNIKASKKIEELYITDLSGKVLQILKNIQANEVVRADLSGYASGIYLIRYPLGKQWVSGKVVLSRR